eukprot:TRINITY_DN2250_c0_g1_i2.p1 TRINITY_DN2250_c0_g1~~TRINITY_DN2250_c0_g1_i2.p1  ORF type:complete len:273 (-),score=41.00 TRINITY_DN2250_c0_g1_i2:96-914(-)
MSATSMEELPEPHAEVKAKWIKLQLDLKKKLVQKDSFEWKVPSGDGDSDLRLIGGVDISFVKGNPVDACACLVVVSYPDLEVVYTACEMVQLTEPYISTFLAFREAPFLVDLVSELRKKSPELVPQLILVDGNGVLHPRGFGLASHLGVLCGIPTIGVGKSFLFVDGVTDKSIRTLCKQKCHAKGDYVFIVGQSGTTHGAAIRTTAFSVRTASPDDFKPIYISIGHGISLDSAVVVVNRIAKFRIPEPVRQADLISRQYLKDNFKPSSGATT